MDACSKTLFSAWAKRPGADGQIPYDDFGEVTVSAISLACFPNMKFPENANDRPGVQRFPAAIRAHPSHPERHARRQSFHGRTESSFLFLHGTVAFQIPDDELSRRLSLGMAITQRRGYLLTWFFAAPHDSELQDLTNERASFDSRAGGDGCAVPPQPGGGSYDGRRTKRACRSAKLRPTSALCVASGDDAGEPPRQRAPATEYYGDASPYAGSTGTTQQLIHAAIPASSRRDHGSQQGKGAPIKK